MPIANSVLARWSHHSSGTAPIQAHMSIRDTLEGLAKDYKHKVFLQGSYKNNTNIRQDSDVDLVVQLMIELPPGVANLSDIRLKHNQTHKLLYERWKSFRKKVLKVLRDIYGKEAVTSGRKSLKVPKGKIPASADVVVTLRCGVGMTFYLPDQHRWVISFPEQHYKRGVEKEKATNNIYKRTIRMFKAARNHLLKRQAIGGKLAPSYFIECLLYNVPNNLFVPKLNESYCSIIEYLLTANLQSFKCQNGLQNLFGLSRDQWIVDEAKRFILVLQRLWEKWPTVA